MKDFDTTSRILTYDHFGLLVLCFFLWTDTIFLYTAIRRSFGKCLIRLYQGFWQWTMSACLCYDFFCRPTLIFGYTSTEIIKSVWVMFWYNIKVFDIEPLGLLVLSFFVYLHTGSSSTRNTLWLLSFYFFWSLRAYRVLFSNIQLGYKWPCCLCHIFFLFRAYEIFRKLAVLQTFLLD